MIPYEAKRVTMLAGRPILELGQQLNKQQGARIIRISGGSGWLKLEGALLRKQLFI